MSREDVQEIVNIVTKEVSSIDNECFVVPVGGYRYIYNIIQISNNLSIY